MLKFLIINTATGEFVRDTQFSSWVLDAHEAHQFISVENARAAARIIYNDFTHVGALTIQPINTVIQILDGGETIIPPWVDKYVIEIDVDGEEVVYFNTHFRSPYADHARLFDSEMEALDKAREIQREMEITTVMPVTVLVVSAETARAKFL